jgi:hypothetical protein
MGKRGRNTAKTGDRALYKNRNNTLIEAKNSHRKLLDEERNDHLYSAVDRFHNQREKDFLKLDGSDNDDDDENINNIDTVMDLAAGGENDDDDESDDYDSDDEDENDVNDNNIKPSNNDDDYSSSEEDEELSAASSNDDNLEDDDKNNIRSWGTKKSSYYDGDIIGSSKGDDDDEHDDAELEEIAAKEVQASRLKDMSEDDFIVSDEDNDDDDNDVDVDNDDNDEDNVKYKDKVKSTTTKSVSKIVSNDKFTSLSMKEKRKIIEKQHPEMLPILSHFTDIVQNLQNHTSIATKAIFDSKEENTAEVRSMFHAFRKDK